MHSGIAYLQEILMEGTSRIKPKTNSMPIFSLISQLLSSLKEYIHSDFKGIWADFIAKAKKGNSLSGFIESWILHSSNSLQCQLLSSLSISDDRRKFQLYIRLRKYIIQLLSGQKLDQLLLRHEDTITIIHRMFPTIIRKDIARGVKQMFIRFKVTDPKQSTKYKRIYACVFIEYILSIYDSIGQEDQSLMIGDTKISSQLQISNFSTIKHFNSNLHKNNGFYKAIGTDNNYNIIQAKFLPHELERRKSHLGDQENQSYYYSNSINYQDNSQINEDGNSNVVIGWKDKQNVSENKLSSTSHFFEGKKEFLNQSSQLPSNQQSALHSLSNNVSVQFQQLTLRNHEFKQKMLSKDPSDGQISHESESTITDTINIIHTSIVRNHGRLLN